MENLIILQDVKKTYEIGLVKVEVLKGVNLQVGRGETLAIEGASGVGKSTLLHIIGTLDRPTSGTVIFDGEDAFKRSDKRLAEFRNKHVGFVFQFHHLLPEFTALENAMMPLLIAGLPKRQAIDKASGVLERMGLSHRLQHKPGEISGGEQQRVALARALVMNPLVLLADEPTGNLDGKTADDIHDLLLELNDSFGTTMIVVTHNQELSKLMKTRITLEEGREKSL